MMPALHIKRLRARYSLRGFGVASAGAKSKLDRLLRSMGQEEFEAALARLGLPSSEIICLRALHVPVRIDLSRADAVVSGAWIEAFASALATAIGRSEGFVRYGSRSQALVDVLISVGRADVSRAWAWRQLGLWRDAAEAIGVGAAAAMMALPESVPAALVEVAKAGALPGLISRVAPDDWMAVARAAIATTGASSIRTILDAAGEGSSPGTRARRDVSEMTRATARAVLAQSRLARSAARLAGLDLRAREAMAIFAILEVDPAALSRLSDPRALLEVLLSDSMASGPKRPGGGDQFGSLRAEAKVVPQGRAERSNSIEQDRGDRQAQNEALPTASIRRCGRTRAGGLLFLLHIVGELGLPETLCAPGSALAGRSLRWVLHQIALCLLPLEPNDAAALAFAGLAPDADRPSHLAEPVTELEQHAIRVASDAIVARLRQRVGNLETPRAALLLQTCRRSAEVLADPAWIEVCLSLDDVSTLLRRAGLDLDLGWLPWLGCVVRFRYA